jgi:hypothetical protein
MVAAGSNWVIDRVLGQRGDPKHIKVIQVKKKQLLV